MKRSTIDQFFKSKLQKTEELRSENSVGPENDTNSEKGGEEDASGAYEGVEQSDIGVLVDKIQANKVSGRPTNDEQKKIILTEVFVPKKTFSFPVSEHNNKKRKFQHSWLEKWSWLAYSKEKDGAYCKYCIAFGPEFSGKGAHQKVESLVVVPFKKWKDATEKLTTHSNSEYHKFSSIAADNFLRVYSGKTEDVATLIDSQRGKIKEKNREFLRPIVETIIFLGENEIALRGHRDCGPLSLEKPKEKDGKFRALVRFRAATDSKLKQHLENSAQNAKYISPEIQNEVIEVCGNLVQKKLVQEINSSDCFAILADETMDISGKEQFSLCIRYISQNSMLKEDFLTFTQIVDVSAESIVNVILSVCNTLNLDMSKVIGQGYDGCSTFSGHITGVHTRFQQLYPKAVYVHCSAHKLNLVLSSSLNIPCIRNCLGTVKEVSNLLRNNVQASDSLKKNISELLPQSKKTRLLGLCETRFIERQDSINTFLELLPAVIATLQGLSESSRSVSTTASNLLLAMEKSSFFVSLVVCEYLFSLTLPLSNYLQKTESDLSSAVNYADNVIQTLQDLRASNEGELNDVEEFTKLFNKAENLLKDNFDLEISVPRQSTRQTQRVNVPYNTTEEYYRRSIFTPCIDVLISGLIDRFGTNKALLKGFEILLPKHVDKHKVRFLSDLKMYYEDTTTQAIIESEYVLWCTKWSHVENKDRPKTIMAVLDSCDRLFYPNINYLIRVLATLPVSTAEVERSFSSLKRIKTYLRNSMENDRLTGLALLSVHYPVPITPDEVLDEMARMGKRRILF